MQAYDLMSLKKRERENPDLLEIILTQYI